MTNPLSPVSSNAPKDLQNHLQKLRKRMARPGVPNAEPWLSAEPPSSAQSIGEDISLTIFNLFDILRRRFFLVIFLAGLIGLLVFQWSRSRPKMYRAHTILEVAASSPKVFTNIRDVSEDRVEVNQFYGTQIEILRSTTVAQKALNSRPSILNDPGFYGLDRVSNKELQQRRMAQLRPRAALLLVEKTTILPIRKSSLFRVYVEDTDPQRARDLVEALSESYQEYDRLFRLRTTLNAYKEIKTRLTDYQQQYKDLQKTLMDFRTKNNLLSSTLDDRKNLAFKELEEVNQQLIRTALKRIEFEAQLGPVLRNEIKDPLKEFYYPLLSSEVVIKLQSMYNEALLKQDQFQEKYRAKHPDMKKLNQHLQRLREVLVEQINQIYDSYRMRYKGIRKEEQSLKIKVASAKKALQELDQINLGLEQYRQQLKALEESLSILNKRYFEVQLLKDSITSNVRVVEQPRTPEDPFAPRTLRDALIAFALSLVLLFGFFILLEIMDRSIRSMADIEEKAGVPPIGEVPLLTDTKRGKKGPEPLYNPDKPLSPIEEAIRSIRTNLFFLAGDQPVKRILLTSPSPREGKTFIATNLAIGIAHAGKKTVLVDTDMRRPRVHKILQLDYDRSKGTSSVIIGQHTLDEALIETKYPNLWILPCGPIPPSPTELLQTQGFFRLYEELQQRFEVVLFDSPPILSVTDAAVLASHVDGIVMISSCGSTNWSALQAAAHKLESVGGRILGCILNKVSDKDRGYSYRYSRGYYYAPYRYRYYGERDE